MFVDMLLFMYLAWRYVPAKKFVEDEDVAPLPAIKEVKPNSTAYDNPSFKDD